MILPFSAFFRHGLSNCFLSHFKKGASDSVSKPDATDESKEHNYKCEWTNQRKQTEKLGNKQHYQSDNHAVHFLAGFDNQSSRIHNSFPFLDLTITPFPLSPLTLWGDL